MTSEKILVPLDGSLFAEAALSKAAELIRENSRATLILLRAVEAPTYSGVDPTDAQVAVVQEAEEYLENVAARLREDGVANVKTSVWYGPAARTILEVARITNSDLIMMGTHGRSGIGRPIQGSVAESVLRGARTPLFLVRVDGTRLKTRGGKAPVRERQAAHV